MYDCVYHVYVYVQSYVCPHVGKSYFVLELHGTRTNKILRSNLRNMVKTLNSVQSLIYKLH